MSTDPLGLEPKRRLLRRGGGQQMTEISKTVAPGVPGRPTRALIGWMPDDLAQRVQMGNSLAADVPPEVSARARRAREAVLRRAPTPPQVDVLGPVPGELEPYIASLRNDPVGGAFLAEGWNVSMV